MKKAIILICLILSTIGVKASKAISTPFQVRQPDGTILTLMLHGDEHFSWITTPDNALVIETHKGYYIAKINDYGKLMATSQLAHNASNRTDLEKRLIQLQNRSSFFNTAEKAMRTRRAMEIGTTTPPYFPHTGSPKVLTILVEFSDSTFYMSNPKKNFNQYLNCEGKPEKFDAFDNRNFGSVRQYFKDMSGGKFTPQFDVIGPIRLSKPLSYYGADGKGGNPKDLNIRELIKEACSAVDDSVNFKDYDNNNDGIADLVYVIYAGYSQSVGNLSTDIWPKSSWLSEDFKLDGVSIKRFGVSNELNYTRRLKDKNGKKIKVINGIGLFCHEFSHTMGLPDFYPYNQAAQIDNQTMEFWDLMDGGEYTDAGYTPTPYTPWEKEVMGWKNIETLANDTAKITLKADEALKITSDDAREYIVLHNIANQGWHKALYKSIGHGMLVYRINYERGKVNMFDHVNDTPGKPGMTIVPADGLLITSYHKEIAHKDYVAHHAGDPFPGTSDVHSIENIKLNHSTLNKPIYNIKETNDAITFEYLKDLTAAGIEKNESAQTAKLKKDMKIYNLNGKFMGINRNELPHGVYIQNNEKFVK